MSGDRQSSDRGSPWPRWLFTYLPGLALAIVGGCTGLVLGEPLSDALLDWRTPGLEVRSGDVLGFLPFAIATSLGLGLPGGIAGFVAGVLGGGRLYDRHIVNGRSHTTRSSGCEPLGAANAEGPDAAHSVQRLWGLPTDGQRRHPLVTASPAPAGWSRG